MEHNKEALGKGKNYISQYREPGRNQFRALDYQGSKKERDESRARNKRPNAAAADGAPHNPFMPFLMQSAGKRDEHSLPKTLSLPLLVRASWAP